MILKLGYRVCVPRHIWDGQRIAILVYGAVELIGAEKSGGIDAEDFHPLIKPDNNESR